MRRLGAVHRLVHRTRVRGLSLARRRGVALDTLTNLSRNRRFRRLAAVFDPPLLH
jgi:hypothetical protein